MLGTRFRKSVVAFEESGSSAKKKSSRRRSIINMHTLNPQEVRGYDDQYQGLGYWEKTINTY